MMHSAPRVMIVEDETVIAFDVIQLVAAKGYHVVGHARSSAAVLRLADESRPDLAVVDLELADGLTGLPLAKRLRELGTAVVILTGRNQRISGFRVIAKPASEEQILSALVSAAAER